MITFYLFSFLFGLCIGSFLNALEYRLKNKKNFVTGRSMCPLCQKQLKWWHNIPLLSFTFLKGKCAFCKTKINWQYPLVELVTGFLFLGIFFIAQNFLEFGQLYFLIKLFWLWMITAVLVFIFVYDFKYMLILDSITLPAIFVSLAVQVFLIFSKNNGWSGFWFDYKMVLFSAIIGGGWFLVLYLISKGKWIGGGDIRLGFLMGALLPWTSLVGALAFSYVLGTFIVLPLVLSKKKGLKSEVPFGVFLVPSTFIFLFWGERVIDWYLGFLL
jgi:leader peptidase (prepilin peptidase) / N-methyltransferase